MTDDRILLDLADAKHSAELTCWTIFIKGKHPKGFSMEGFVRKMEMDSLSLTTEYKWIWFTDRKKDAKAKIHCLKNSLWSRGGKWKCKYKLYRLKLRYMLEEEK